MKLSLQKQSAPPSKAPSPSAVLAHRTPVPEASFFPRDTGSTRPGATAGFSLCNVAILPPGAEREPRAAMGVAASGIAGIERPLPFRAEMEAAFGASFADVRVHHDAAAALATRRLGARAYTFGSRIALSSPSPSRALIAHELSHVLQQRASSGLAYGVGRRGDRFEREADTASAAALRGEPARVGRAHASVPAVQLSEGPEGQPEAEEAPTPEEEAAQQSLPPGDSPYEAAMELLPPGASAPLAPLTAEEMSVVKAPVSQSLIDGLVWMSHLVATIVPIRLVKVLYYGTMLVKELPEVAKIMGRHTDYVKGLKSLYGVGGAGAASAGRLRRASKKAAKLAQVSAKGGATLLKKGFAYAPALELAAPNLRIFAGWATADFKTIVRHVFWTKRRVIIPHLEKVGENLMAHMVRKVIAGRVFNEHAIRTIVRAGLEEALRKGLFDVPLAAVKPSIAETKLGREVTAAEKAVQDAEKAAGAETAAKDAAKRKTTSAIVKESEGVAEAAEGAAEKLAEQAKLVRSGKGWIVRKAAKVEKALVSVADAIGHRVAQPLMQTLFFNEMEKAAADVLGKSLTAGESKLATELAKEVTAKAMQKAVHKIVAAGAIASGAYTTMKAAEAFGEGKTLLGAIKTAHAVTDFIGVVPGVGVAISFAGDVVFLTLEWYVEDESVQEYLKKKNRQLDEYVDEKNRGLGYWIHEKVTLPIWNVLAPEISGRVRL